MTHKELIERYNDFGVVEWDKQLYIEYLIIMNYMSDEDFNNMLNVENISDEEFMSILDFYFENKCFLMLFKILRDYRVERFVKPKVESIQEIEIREDFEERQKKFYM